MFLVIFQKSLGYNRILRVLFFKKYKDCKYIKNITCSFEVANANKSPFLGMGWGIFLFHLCSVLDVLDNLL